jgi:hypothetical protein
MGGRVSQRQPAAWMNLGIAHLKRAAHPRGENREGDLARARVRASTAAATCLAGPAAAGRTSAHASKARVSRAIAAGSALTFSRRPFSSKASERTRAFSYTSLMRPWRV